MLLLIDHYDSFSSNVAYYCRCLGAEMVQVNHDEISLEWVIAHKPTGIIFSPGPGHPRDTGISRTICEYFAGKIPLLGICLGHQLMGLIYGGEVISAPFIRHGKVSRLEHTGQGLFYDLPSPFSVTRYHSLIVSDHPWPECLHMDAWVMEGDVREVMAFSHRDIPLFGWQFHPEALMTEYGSELLRRFIVLCEPDVVAPSFSAISEESLA
jgi:anthranilate synthase/aminodeoxychorismate synthase-like glutamine amidotransferase